MSEYVLQGHQILDIYRQFMSRLILMLFYTVPTLVTQSSKCIFFILLLKYWTLLIEYL